jgi:hypothetical protein
MKSTCLVASALLSLLALSANGQNTSWNLSGSGGEGSFENTLIFQNSGIVLKATAWAYTFGTKNDALETAALGRWSTGLGVTDQAEGLPAGNPEHQVDNYGPDNWVLFQFSSPMENVSVVINPYGVYDRDVTYWTGNTDSSITLTGKTYSDLSALGFGTLVNDTSVASEYARAVTISSATPFTTLLFGTQMGEPTGSNIDRFKIVSIAGTAVPEPSAFSLLGLGLMAFAFRRSRR